MIRRDMDRYELMVLITKGVHEGYYKLIFVDNIFKLADLYVNNMELIEKCHYIYDRQKDEYLSEFDKDKILRRAEFEANFDPFRF